MANVETSVTELKINKLTKAQYDTIASPSNTELYFIKDEAIDYSDIINTPDLSTVALSGSYLDLINKPTIPTTTDDLLENSPAAITSGGAYANLVSNVVQTGTSDRFTVTKNGNSSVIIINNVANATTASKLGSTTIGNTTTPIYLNSGTATPINYTIAKSVPADAKFTDTTYDVFTGATSSTAGTAGLVKKPNAGDQNKYLQGNGEWTVVDALPSQTSQSGKFLTTDGTSASWTTISQVPSQTGQSGKFLTTNGTTASWVAIEEYTATEVETLWNSI